MKITAKFDSSNPCWSPDLDYSLEFIRVVTHLLNGELDAYGCVSLNNAFKMLGLPQSELGKILGWTHFVDITSEVLAEVIELTFNVDDEPVFSENKKEISKRIDQAFGDLFGLCGIDSFEPEMISCTGLKVVCTDKIGKLAPGRVAIDIYRKNLWPLRVQLSKKAAELLREVLDEAIKEVE